MKRDRLVMFGAITALTLSLFWAVRFLPGGSHGVPGLLSIGSLVHPSPGPANFDAPIQKRCGFSADAVIAREITERVGNRSRHIRIQVLHGSKHRHKHKRVHKRERRRCRSRITTTQPALPILAIPAVLPIRPVSPAPPIPPIPLSVPLPAPGS